MRSMEAQVVEDRGPAERAIKVSVVVPVYNPGPHMDDLVRSVLGQSLPRAEYEVVFVDDGSTDGTAERLDELAARHQVVRVAHMPNSGWPGRPRNVGTDMASGEFVLFVDNDDWLGAEALERAWTAPPPRHARRSHLVRTGSFEALADLARFERSLKARVRVLDVEGDEGRRAPLVFGLGERGLQRSA